MGPLLLSREQFLSIVQAGVLAPSADNRHPLRFDRTDDCIRIWGDEGFSAAQFHRRVLFLISIGAVVENMVLRAREVGLQTAVRWFPVSGEPLLVAALNLTAVDASSDALSRAIPDRHTNRRFLFHGPALADKQRQELTEDAQSIAGIRLLWLDQPALRGKALRLIRIAEAERFRCRPLHDEMFSSIRFEVGWNSPAEEGLAPGSLEVERPLRGVFRALGHWGLTRMLAGLGVHIFLGLRSGDAPCRLSPHLGVLGTTLALEPGAVAVGRALERIWLCATSFGFAFQPLAASTLFALDGYQDVRARLRESLAEGWAEIDPDIRPLIVFRLGWSAPASVRSGRRPVEAYLRP